MNKHYHNTMNELENRCIQFSVNIRLLAKTLEKSIGNIEDLKQVVRSSGSIGANYIEANEALRDKDRLMRLKISRKEAKETVYWQTILIQTNNNQTSIVQFNNEAQELRKIFSTIINKLSK